MGRANRDVGGYRGRRTVTDILRFIAIALAVLVILAVAAAVYLQRYLVYTDDGVRLELPPFLQMLRGERSSEEPGSSVSLPDPGSVSVIVDPDGSGARPAPEPEIPGFALQVPVAQVLDGTAAARLEQTGAEALILEMKAPGGQLAWCSEQRAAERAEVNAPRSNNEAFMALNAGDVYTIARVCCFRDDSVPYFHNKQALRKGNYNWRDELSLRWLSPANETAQAYIAALCGELGALGFDEIVLEQFHFPVQGKLDAINRGESYDPAAFAGEVESLLTQVQAAVEPYGTKLSLRFTADVLTGEGPALSGVTAELLDRYAARFWTEQDGWTALGSGIQDLTARTVEIVPEAGESRSRFQAVLLPEE